MLPDQSTSEWKGDDGEGGCWEVSVECDCFAEGLPFVVSIFVISDDEERGEKRSVTALACASADQAREMAAAFIAAADNTDFNNARIASADAS